MAKDKNEIDFDDGLEDFDFDFGDDDFSFTPPKDDRKPVVRVAAGFLEGVKNDLVSPEQIRRRALKMMPDEYTDAANLVNTVADTGRNLYNTATEQLRPAIKETKRTIQRFMPKAREYLPKKYADKLDDLTKEDPHAGKGPSQEEIRNASIDQTMADIFKVQMSADAENRERDGVDQQMQRKTDERRYRSELAALNNISSGVNRQVAYQDQVTAKYQKLSLELQFRQTYLLSDTFELAKATSRDHNAMLADIVKNTGLPETEKVHLTEQASHRFKEGLIGAGQNKLAQYRKDLFPNMGKNLDKLVKQNAADFRDRLLGVTSQLDMLGADDDGPKLDGANLVGSSLGGIAGGWLADKGAKLLKPIIGDNEYVKRGADKLNYNMKRLPGYLNDLADRADPTDKSFWGGVKRVGAQIIGPYNVDMKAGPNVLDSAREQVEFDDLSRRSITEIIPGFLSRIHHELAIIRTGDSGLDRTVYNLNRGEFTDFKQATSDTANRLVSKKDAQNVNEKLDQAIKEIEGDVETLTPAARKALRDRLLKTAGSGRDFSVDRFADDDFWGSDTDPEHVKQITDHFKDRYGLESQTSEDSNGLSNTRIVSKDSKQYDANRAAYGKRVEALIKHTPEPTAAIRSFMNVGQIEQLKALGLITTDGTQHSIDPAQYWSMLQGGQLNASDSETNTGPVNPFVGPPRPPSAGPGPDSLRGPVNPVPPAPPGPNPEPAAAVIPPAFGPGFKDLIDAYTAGNESLVRAVVANRLKDETDQTNDTLLKILTLLESGDLFVQTGEGQDPAAPGSRNKRFNTVGGHLRSGLKWGKDRVLGAGKLYGDLLGAQWAGIKAGSGLLGKGVSKTAKGIGSAWSWMRGKKDTATTAVKDRYEQIRDLYVQGKLWPSITAEGLAAGEYFDALTGKAITKLEEIKGPVKDKLGNIVLSTQDFAKGFYDSTGKPLALKAWNKLTELGGKLGGAMLAPYQAVFGAARKTFDRVKAFIERPRDLYVPGEETPRLLAHVMEAGGYMDKATGNVIRSFKDIRGTIIDAEGNVVLTLEDMRKGLVDAAGKSIKSFGAWAFGKALHLAATPIRMARAGIDIGKRAVKGAWGALKGFGSKLKMPKGLSVGGGSSEMMETIGEYQILLLEEIRDAVRSLGPKRTKGDSDGDGVRDGSYADQLKHKTKKEEKTDPKKPEEKKEPKSWIGKLGLMLAGVLGKGLSSLKDLFGGFLKAKAAGGLLDAAGDLVGGGTGKKGLLRRGAGLLGRGAWGATKLLGRGAWGATKLLGSGLGGTASLIGRGALAAAPLLGSGIAATAGAIGSGAMALGSGLLTAGTAIAGVLSAPVVLGVGAVALAAAGAWWLYKKYDASKDRPLRKLRLAQYGVATTEEDQAKKVLGLEDTLYKNITYGKDGAGLNESKLNIPELLKDFGFGEGDDEAIDQFSQWYNARFKPVFLTHCTALRNLASNVALDSIDEDLSVELKLTYINATKFASDGSSPYLSEVSPFGKGSKLSAGLAEIQAAEQEAIAKVKAELDKTKGPGAGKLAEEAADPTSKPAGEGTFEAEALAPLAMTRSGAVDKQAVAKAATDASKITNNSPALASLALVGGDIDVSVYARDKVDAVTAVRYRAYGLTAMDYEKVNNLDTLEQAAAKDISYNNNRIAVFNGSAEAYAKQYSGRFGVSVSNTQGYADWLVWFRSRFLPVLLNLYSAVRALSSSVNPFNAYKELTNAQLLGLVEAMTSSKGQLSGDDVSVWVIRATPWPGYPINVDADSIRSNVDALKEGLSATTYNEETGKATNQTDLDKVAADLKKSGLVPSNLNGETAKPGFLAVNQYTSANDAGGKPNYGALNTAYSPTSTGPNGGSMTGGQPVIHQGAGSGGSINDLPQSKGDGSWDAHKDVIVGAAKMAGVDPALMATMAAIESGFRSNVKAGTSSATGLYQFISGTWREMLNKYGSKYGINPNTPPTDSRANALMGAEFVKQNQTIVEKVLGRPATDTDLYMAHFLGAGGASKFLKLDPSANAAQAMPKEAAANRSIFFGPGNAPRTAGEVYALMDSKVKSRREAYGDSARTLAGAPSPVTKPASGTASGPGADTEAKPAPVTADATAVPTTTSTGGTAASDTAAPTVAAASTAPAAPAAVSTAYAPTINSSKGLTAAMDSSDAAVADRKTQAAVEAQQTQVQAAAVTKAQSSTTDDMVKVMNAQLQVQQSMDTTLKSIETGIQQMIAQGGPANNGSSGPTQTPVKAQDTTVRGNRAGVVEASSLPINMKRVS